MIQSVKNCIKKTGNTGFTGCAYNIDKIDGIILTPNVELDEAEVLALASTLTTKCKEDKESDRFYPITKMIGFENQNQESVTATSSYGILTKVRNGQYGMKFDLAKNGLAWYNQIATFDNQHTSFRVFLIDGSNNVIVGTRSTGNKVKGFSLSMLSVENMMLPDGSNPVGYSVSINLDDADQLNKRAWYAEVDSDDLVLNDLTGLYNVEVTPTGTAVQATGIFDVVVTSMGYSYNLYDSYSTQITAMPTLFNVKYNGTTIPILTVVAKPSIKGFTIDLDQTNAAYPASAGATLDITFGSVSALETANIVGYSNAEATVKTA